MTTTKFHRDVAPGIPGFLALPQPGLSLYYSRHALDAASDEGISRSTLPFRLPPIFGVVEVTTTEGSLLGLQSVSKSLVRIPCHTRWRRHWFDLVLSVTPTGQVLTVWLNSSEDTHTTLDSRAYGRNDHDANRS